MEKVYLVVRNLVCGLLALFLILCRRARRGREQAFRPDTITPIYFHKPSRRLFTACLRWLMCHGYTFLSADDLIAILRRQRPIPRGAAWISLDDGYWEWLVDVVPVVRRYKVPVTLFIPSGIVQGDGLFPWLHNPSRGGNTSTQAESRPTPNHESVTVRELQQIAGCSEITIGAHTVNHAVTPHCTAEELRFEIGECKRTLELWTGRPVQCFAYPEGCYDGSEIAVLREFDFAVAATTVPRFIRPDTHPLTVPRFCVPDGVTLPEAICAMVGVWRPCIDPIKKLLGLGSGGAGPALPPTREAAGQDRATAIDASVPSVSQRI